MNTCRFCNHENLNFFCVQQCTVLDDPADLKHLEFRLVRNKVFRHCRRLFKDIFLKSCYFHPLSHFLNFLPPADAPWPAVGNLPSWYAGQPPGWGRSLSWNQTNLLRYIYLFSQGIQISLLILFLLPQVLQTKVFITFSPKTFIMMHQSTWI